MWIDLAQRSESIFVSTRMSTQSLITKGDTVYRIRVRKGASWIVFNLKDINIGIGWERSEKDNNRKLTWQIEEFRWAEGRSGRANCEDPHSSQFIRTRQACRFISAVDCWCLTRAPHTESNFSIGHRRVGVSRPGNITSLIPPTRGYNYDYNITLIRSERKLCKWRFGAFISRNAIKKYR